MVGSNFGMLFWVSIFGELYGKVLGVIVDGCFVGVLIDEDFI